MIAVANTDIKLKPPLTDFTVFMALSYSCSTGWFNFGIKPLDYELIKHLYNKWLYYAISLSIFLLSNQTSKVSLLFQLDWKLLGYFICGHSLIKSSSWLKATAYDVSYN